MSNTVGSSAYTSTNAGTSTLRPRNNRLISFLDEPGSENDAAALSISRSTSAPLREPSPTTTHSRNHSAVSSTERVSRPPKSPTADGAAGRRSSSLWDSWNSIQGVAASLLSGGDRSPSVGRKGSMKKSPAWMKQDTKFGTTATMSSWGPESQGPTTTKPESAEDRYVAVQAKKREALLLSCAQEARNELGHHKRKASYDDHPTARPPDPDAEEDVLVYMHRVRPQDTIAGVTIRYSCQPEAFRKINRFWPNDNIQTRAFVLLPVNACSVRGRKLDDAGSLELLSHRLNGVELDAENRSSSIKELRNSTADTPPVLSTSTSTLTEGLDYKHDSYVQLPSFAEPVEILRIPQRTLGHFPRTRRKSAHLQSSPTGATPKTSFDMLRHPPSHAAQQAALQAASHAPPSLSLQTSPRQRPRMASSSRQRSSSTAATTSTNSKNAWILRGPGGVGTLRGLRTEGARPGPAEDSLNQKFAHYFPSLVLQSESEDLDGRRPSRHSRSRTNTMSRSPYRATPRASTDSIRSSRSNSSTFGTGVSGVESFMRKLATGGKRPDLGPRLTSGDPVNSIGLPIGGETGLGDLIELETNSETLHDDPLTARPRDRTERGARRAGDDEDDDATPTETGRSVEDLLNERFPIRGRITRAYGGDDD